MKAQYKDMMFKIEEDVSVGFYLYIYKNGKCVADYLQDSATMCKEFAHEEFGVPLKQWNMS